MQMKGKWYHDYTIALHYSTIAHTLAKFLTMCAFNVTYNILYWCTEHSIPATLEDIFVSDVSLDMQLVQKHPSHSCRVAVTLNPVYFLSHSFKVASSEIIKVIL